ncbi:hypothetical protein AUI51_02605 [archaeon 13_1_40CM_2_52_4]|nr:MAG: hypothetical protein AUI51_02605 [archaeon 13_1_40CM_2_52_4]
MPLRIDCGLSVRNTDVYFVIRNMYVHAATYGIVLSDVRNGEIDNSTLVNNGLGGVAVLRSNYVTISSNNITRNGYSFQRYRPSFGLAVYGSTNVVVSRDTVSSNLGRQMTAYGSDFLISQNRFSYTNLVIPQSRFSVSSGGVYFEGLNNATISHNQFLAENGIGVSISMSYFTQVTISANVFTSSGIVFEPLPSAFTSADLTMTTDNLIDGRPILLQRLL